MLCFILTFSFFPLSKENSSWLPKAAAGKGDILKGEWAWTSLKGLLKSAPGTQEKKREHLKFGKRCLYVAEMAAFNWDDGITHAL